MAVLFLTSGCNTASKKSALITRGEAFTQIYTEKPRSIVVLPPINTSTLPRATDYYMATIEEPLSQAGYDVLPQISVNKIIEKKNVQDTKALYSLPLNTLYEFFDTDTVLYTRIKQWDIAQTGLISRLIISIEAEILSTKTSQQLWRYNSSLNIDLNTLKSSTGSLQVLIQEMLSDSDEATETATAYGQRLNSKLTRDLPYGPNHTEYLKDQENEMIGSVPEKSILNN